MKTNEGIEINKNCSRVIPISKQSKVEFILRQDKKNKLSLIW